ncbi:hypothetical protein FGO68_gene9140 [Halteria grandinella]|uniref:Uncharacterized protein n=1 Tax=Halteria grandinella TaxID=5974 RepID=A0A8J8SVB2_HALGN|nr:hypothetical protein FGO68_gene9140 [Halteria grandinella]
MCYCTSLMLLTIPLRFDFCSWFKAAPPVDLAERRLSISQKRFSYVKAQGRVSVVVDNTFIIINIDFNLFNAKQLQQFKAGCSNIIIGVPSLSGGHRCFNVI